MDALRMFAFQTIPEEKKDIFSSSEFTNKFWMDLSLLFGERLTGGESGVTEMVAMFSLHLPGYVDLFMH